MLQVNEDLQAKLAEAEKGALVAQSQALQLSEAEHKVRPRTAASIQFGAQNSPLLTCQSIPLWIAWKTGGVANFPWPVQMLAISLPEHFASAVMSSFISPHAWLHPVGMTTAVLASSSSFTMVSLQASGERSLGRSRRTCRGRDAPWKHQPYLR